MLTRRIGAVPVVDDDRLVGIVTLTDLLDHCLESLRDPEVLAAAEKAQG
jgi:CBS domain-containing protein